MSLLRKRPVKSASVNPYRYFKSSYVAKNNKAVAKHKLKGLSWFSRSNVSFLRILVVLAGFGLTVYLFSATTDPIVRFSSTGTNARETTIYRQQIQKILKKSLFNRSKLLFDYRGVERSIKAEFPELESVQISFDLIGRRPVTKLITLEPAYIFQTNGLAWVVDERGIAIGLQSDLKESFTASLETITDEVGTNAAIGSSLMSLKQTNFLSSMYKLLEKQLVVITEVFLPGSPKELDIKVAGDSWRYKLNIDEQPAGQAGTLLAAQQTFKSNNLTPTEYVDLRTSEKVFWK